MINVKNKKMKLVVGALIIALVISIFPADIFANSIKTEKAATSLRKFKLISKEEAESIAIKVAISEGAVKEELKVAEVIDDTENKKPQYYFRLKTLTHVYFVEVNARTGEVIRFVEVLLKNDKVNKPNDKDDLNKELKSDKKEAIKKFQEDMKKANNKKLENKDDFQENKDKYKQMKKDAIEKFKKAKDEIKELKKSDKKDEKPINKIKYLTEEEAKDIAIKKFNKKNIKPEDIKFKLEKEKNPPAYILEYYDKVNKTIYELVIHATAGIILEYEKALE